MPIHWSGLVSKEKQISKYYNSLDEYQIDSMLTEGYDFSSINTLQLLGWLRSQEGRENSTLNAVLKAELAKRENVPTKAQSKAKRQQIAKAKKNR